MSQGCRGTQAHAGVPAQVAWVGALKGVIMAMHGFVKQHHPDAVRWNKSGCPLSAFKPSASGAGKQLTSRHAKHLAYDAEGAWGPLCLVDSRQCFHQVDLPVCAWSLAWFLLCAQLGLPAVTLVLEVFRQQHVRLRVALSASHAGIQIRSRPDLGCQPDLGSCLG